MFGRFAMHVNDGCSMGLLTITLAGFRVDLEIVTASSSAHVKIKYDNCY